MLIQVQGSRVSKTNIHRIVLSTLYWEHSHFVKRFLKHFKIKITYLHLKLLTVLPYTTFKSFPQRNLFGEYTKWTTS